MRKDPTEFERRFLMYKNGEMPYENGLPKYATGKPRFTKNQEATISTVFQMMRAAGWDDMSIYGILGNAMTESGLNPDSASASKTYHGLFQNHKKIKEAIVDKYGDYSLASLLKYVIDWANGEEWIKKGKYAPYTVTNTGKYKKSGYKTSQEAAEAFMKLYERPVILDKDGNVVGYQGLSSRLSNSLLFGDYANTPAKQQSFIRQSMLNAANTAMKTYSAQKPTINGGNAPMAITENTGDGKVMYFEPGFWGEDDPRLNRPLWMPKEPRTVDYSIGERAPESISSWNDANAPKESVHMPDIKLYNDLNRALFDVFGWNNNSKKKFGLPPLKSLLPSLDDMLQEQSEDYMKAILGIPEIKPLSAFESGKVPKAILTVNNSNAEFVDRLKSNWRDEIWDWEGSGNRVTHKIASADNIVYPNVLKVNGGLIDFTHPIWKGIVNPYWNAIKTGNYVEMDSEDDARWFGPNYKKYYPPFKNGKLPGFSNGKIHINPANRGKFNATKKRTGKTTEELTHSKNPLTRKRAIFALNARKWKH